MERTRNIVASRKRPEEAELDKKLTELRVLESELAERELALRSERIELLAFQAEYMTTVGALYAELDALEAQIAERNAKCHPGDKGAEADAARARNKAEASRAECQEAVLSRRRNPDRSQKLKSLYRQVAKRIHPDLAVSDADRARRQNLMARANEAYEAGDEDRLRSILNEYEDSPDAIAGDGPAAELVRVIRKIAQVRGRLEAIAAEMQKIAATDLSLLKKKAAQVKDEGRDLLREMAETVKLQIASAKQRLESIP